MADQDTMRDPDARDVSDSAPQPRQAHRQRTPQPSQVSFGVARVDHAAPDRPVPRSQARPRKHMGTASSDPEYLPQTAFQKERAADPNARQTPIRDARAPQRSGTVRYDRYLQTPKPGRAIFSNPQTRRRQRQHLAIIVVLFIALVAVALVWFLVLR